MVQFTPIRGFVNTPVSKSVCIASTVVALLVSIVQVKYLFNLQIDPFIIEYSQYWRIATYLITVINESDFMLCIFLWFLYKILERFFGSRKYLSLIVIFSLYNALICFIFMSFGQIIASISMDFIRPYLGLSDVTGWYDGGFFNKVIPGPLGVVSSLYVCYGKFIPVSYRFNIVLSIPNKRSPEDQEDEEGIDIGSHIADSQPSRMGKVLTLNNHVQIHILYTLLMLNHGIQSIIPCVVGLFLGKLYVNELLPGSKWVLPKVVYKLFVGPTSLFANLYTLFSSSLSGGYDRLSNSVTSDTLANSQLLEDEHEETLDELRSNNGVVIRAETPVRPLGTQFLDTFRT